MTKKDIAERVTPYLRAAPLNGVALSVDVAHIWKGEYSYRVPVRPSALPPSLSSLFEVLADIEATIAEKENFRVLFQLGEPMETVAPPIVGAATVRA